MHPGDAHVHIFYFFRSGVESARWAAQYAGKEVAQITSPLIGLDDWGSHVDAASEIKQLERVVGADLNALAAFDAGSEKVLFLQSSGRTKQSFVRSLLGQK